MAVLAVAETASGQHAVRNRRPESVAVPPADDWRLYYPHDLRASGADEDADAPETLLRRCLNLHTAMRYEEALAVGRELVARAPDRAVVHYNLACVLTRLRRVDEAMDALDRAIDCGWRNALHAEIDPDLQLLRGRDRFATAIARLRCVDYDPTRWENEGTIEVDDSECTVENDRAGFGRLRARFKP